MEQFKHRLNQPPDPRLTFQELDAFVFTSGKLAEFDPQTGAGTLEWARHRRKPRVAFNHMTMPLEAVESWEFPSNYDEPKSLPFSVTFVDERTVRLRWRSRRGQFHAAPTLMLAGPVATSDAWQLQSKDGRHTWSSSSGSVTLDSDPWRITIKDASGKVLLATRNLKDSKCMIDGRPLPFSFSRDSSDLSQTIAASFTLHPGEKIFGCGESFSGFDKRGQSVELWTQDAHGSQTDEMYKPVPFYLSSRGYGVFVHGSSPMLFDFGHSYSDTQVLFSGDESLDLFVFLGKPQEVLTSYTKLGGRSPMPPLWSFGLWMSRITYSSEEETRQVAAKLREHRIPCDVIHLDTGWFEHDWRCNYEFSATRFGGPKQMITDLKEQGFRVSLWQLPYFAPNNPLYTEIIDNGLAVKGPGGELPSEDAVLDFSNPETVAWYQGKLKHLLDQGVAAIKVDFGEGAPLNGLYHSKKTGWYEHNLFPLRYNKAAAEITEQTKGYTLIWARSAWAGSQRYPIHWGGDAEANDGGMLGSLRAGLSLGLSGFSFWSHDVGGFFPATPRDLYLRWLPFGTFTSHFRCHGLPPTEPWEFDAAFVEQFRHVVEFRYRLMPYIWAQAVDCSAKGHPLLRPLFFEFPEDPGSWLVDDAFMFGQDILVAPLFEQVRSRDVYLPPGVWVDLVSGERHSGGGYLHLEPSSLGAVVLGRAGRVLPTVESAAYTGAIDFGRVELLVLGDGPATGLFCQPQEQDLVSLRVNQGASGRQLATPSPAGVTFSFKTLGNQ
jgi:alpha-D-xyloside xylohydrolase